MYSQQARRIAIVGGSGNLGSLTLSSLLAKKIHTLTAITRPDSTHAFPAGVAVKKAAYNDESLLVPALQGQDVLLIQLGPFALDLQDGLIRAAAKAGVKYILPTEFGSDIVESQLFNIFPPLVDKRQRRQLIEELAVSSWIAVINNPWFDWSLSQGFWGIDIKASKATILDGGNTKFNTSTLQRTADATAGLLSLPEDELSKYRNQPFYVSSFYITQREILDSIQRVTNTTNQDWTIVNRDVADVQKESDEELENGDMSALVKKFYSAHCRKGYGGDFNGKVGDLTRFGLQKEDLDQIVKTAVDSVKKA